MSTQQDLLKRVMPWLPMAGAVAAGLVLGLLIGWVWWPVTWTNALLSDLAPSQRAEYLSAVADAYVRDGTDAASARMTSRVAVFGGSVEDELTAALEFYQAQESPDAVRLQNLGRLATDLGVPVDGSMLSATGQEAAAGDEAAPASAVAETPAEEEGGRGILTWILAVLAAGGLIGGGIYLLTNVLRGSAPPDSLTSPSPETLPGEMRPPAPVAAAKPSAEPRTTAWTTTRPQQSKSEDDLSFDDEDDEEPAVRFGRPPGEDFDESDPDDAPPPTPRYSTVGRGPAYEPIERHAGLYDLAGDPDAVAAPAPAGAAAGDKNEAQAFAPARRTARDKSAPPAAAPVAPTPRNGSAANRRVIASYSCQYLVGLQGYIEPYNIYDPASNKHIGECGMSVSPRNQMLHNNPDQAIALDVWLYDKVDPRDNLSNTRILLSDYANDRDFAQALTLERDGTVETLLARPGMVFSMEGRNLTLEGKIADVEYDDEGIFRSLKLQLNVLGKA